MRHFIVDSTLVGILLYICATASTLLAASLIARGLSPGTAFVFLLAGPANNEATMMMVARFLGKRSAVLYMGMISLCVIGAGILLDWIYMKMGVSARQPWNCKRTASRRLEGKFCGFTTPSDDIRNFPQGKRVQLPRVSLNFKV
jgi:hypothetical protein